jgi:hypothetical protein
MTSITIPQLSPRRIGGAFDVKQVARRLGYYAYAETRLMEAQAGWLATIPQAELKIELSYQLYEDACHVDALRERLPELGDFSVTVEQPNPDFVIFCNELTNTEDVLERLVGLFWVLRPHLCLIYHQHIQQSNSVADNPTVRLLERALDDHRRFVEWGAALIEQFSPHDFARAIEWRDHLVALLNQSGGLNGDIQLAPGHRIETPRNAGAGLRFRLDPPVRDERFHIAPYIRREGRAATDVWDEESLLKYMFMNVEGEIEATEACGRTLFDFPHAPWELRFLIARQLWDEARHAELSLQRFFEMGGKLDMLPVRDTFPLYFGPVHNEDLALRLAHLNQVIEGWVTDDFAMMVDICRKLGDERSARLFEQLIADEWLHIKIGSDWIPRLTAGNPAYRSEVINYRLRAEQELYVNLDAAAAETAHRFTTIAATGD